MMSNEKLQRSLFYIDMNDNEKINVQEQIKRIILKITCKDLSGWLYSISEDKHVLVKDSHGELIKPLFLNMVVDSLCKTHKKLIFEPFIKGDTTTSPETRINSFFARNSEQYIKTYRNIKDKIKIIPGDYEYAQPKHHEYHDYIKTRFSINPKIAAEIIEDVNTILFYGSEHMVKRGIGYNIDSGIPDYLPDDSYIILQALDFSNLYYANKKFIIDTVKKLDIFDKDDKTAIYIIPSRVEIDHPSYYIIFNICSSEEKADTPLTIAWEDAEDVD